VRLEASSKPHVHQYLRFFGQILHPQWPAQISKMGQKMDFVLYWSSQKCTAKKDLQKTFINFLWRIEVQMRVLARNCFLNFLNFHIWKRNDRTLMLFFFIDKYCRWDCFPRNKFGIPLTIFPRWTQMRTGRWGQATDKSISLTKSSTPIFEVIMIGFGHSFFHG
jgi:hypothetical protein